MTLSRDPRELRETLLDTFGIRRLRAGQREVIQSVLDGQDTLAIMPTGAGKSLCYQLPALHLPGLTLVVSSLISLMKDQADKLPGAGVDTILINSTLSAHEEREALASLAQGARGIAFVTPERLGRPDFQAVLMASGKRAVSLVVIDEAHCVSQWGHDFRPAFLEIAEAVAALADC